ncbi:GNAT family N-acetyltransferase [Fictibacillus nanhaiensis]|uniref:GNAT family N-acetyltransferase n=1 Tax=Fictibacillus nanhaiensis TaxID=742169 RepID=UPI001C937F66|nr:GNAT family protein [Fictibacillus nanhaiensis]MBY6037608.1 GNAT family N-acetyltransferase [Fictibacillus nanhaiensis]
MDIQDIYSDLPRLETERLILRKITPGDINDMYEYGSDPEVAKYVTWQTHGTLSDTKEFIDFVLRNYDKGEIAPWGIEYKENGKMIGTIDFVTWQPHHKSAEMGYVLSREYWGMGITTEAAEELISFGFQNMDLIRIQARCFIENIGSERVMEKVGMSYEGTVRKAMLAKGDHRDLKVYSVLKEEFARIKD